MYLLGISEESDSEDVGQEYTAAAMDDRLATMRKKKMDWIHRMRSLDSDSSIIYSNPEIAIRNGTLGSPGGRDTADGFSVSW